MKVIRYLGLFGAFISLPVFAQDMSIDEAIRKISAEAKKAIVSGYRSTDETGDFQFVDAEILSVHDINDYSYGSMMANFESILDRRLAHATSNAPSAMWPEERKAVIKENPRLLQYAKDHLTRLVGYSAIVDYIGVTKYRERKNMSVILYFDSKGELIDLRDNLLASLFIQIIGTESDVTDRDDAKKRLSPYMFKQIVSELRAMNDPLFLNKEYWISESIQDRDEKRIFEMQWCYRLTKENVDDSTIDQGTFRAYYYQIQTSFLQTIKMILVVDGTYERDKEHIWLSYNDSTVKSYHITYEATKDFSPGNYKEIDYRICSPQMLESRKAQKLIRAEKNTPDGYRWIDEKTFQMKAPLISDNPCIFKLDD